MRDGTKSAIGWKLAQENDRIRRCMSDDNVIVLYCTEVGPTHTAELIAAAGHANTLYDITVIFDGALDEDIQVITNTIEDVVSAIADDCLKAYREDPSTAELGFYVCAVDSTHAEDQAEPIIQVRYDHGDMHYRTMR